MKIAINGCGIAGPALAWWLKHYGYTPILFEKAPELRQGGYLIDFWGLGHEIAEKMGLIDEIKSQGYDIPFLPSVDDDGKVITGLNVQKLRELTKGQLTSIVRSDLSATLYHACVDIDARFGTYVVNAEQTSDQVILTLSDGSIEKCDLLIGADGLHSHVRHIAFGDKAQFEKPLGIHICALTIANFQPDDDFMCVGYPGIKKQYLRIKMRDEKTLCLFSFRSELLTPEIKKLNDEKAWIREIFKEMKWEVPGILSKLDAVEDFYFDTVSQIKMDKWHNNRIALLGDAAACVSLLGGEGTGLGILEAYVLAGELHKAKGDHRIAFNAYEQRLKNFLEQKQKAALSTKIFFAPKNRFEIFLIRMMMRASNNRFLPTFIFGSLLKDKMTLPVYA